MYIKLAVTSSRPPKKEYFTLPKSFSTLCSRHELKQGIRRSLSERTSLRQQRGRGLDVGELHRVTLRRALRSDCSATCATSERQRVATLARDGRERPARAPASPASSCAGSSRQKRRGTAHRWTLARMDCLDGQCRWRCSE